MYVWHACTYVFMYVCICICTHASMHRWKHTYCRCTYVHMYVCMYEWMNEWIYWTIRSQASQLEEVTQMCLRNYNCTLDMCTQYVRTSSLMHFIWLMFFFSIVILSLKGSFGFTYLFSLSPYVSTYVCRLCLVRDQVASHALTHGQPSDTQQSALCVT